MVTHVAQAESGGVCGGCWLLSSADGAAGAALGRLTGDRRASLKVSLSRGQSAPMPSSHSLS